VVKGQVFTHTRELTGEVIRDIDGFNAFASDWDRLVDQSAVDPMFLSHTWFRTWWEAFGRNNELHVVAIRSGGQLVAAAPMMRTRAAIYGFKVDALHAIYNSHSPRYDFLVANQDPELYRRIWNLLAEASDVDAIVLPQVPVGSGTISAMEELGRQEGWFTGQWLAPVAPVIRLSPDYEGFFNNLKSGCRLNLTKRYARLRKSGPVDVEVVREPSAVDEAMSEGLRIEAAAWKGEKGTAILSDSAAAQFYVRLAKRLADVDQLRLTFLRVAGKRIALNYILQNRKTMYAVKIGYDPQYQSYSPGNMLLNLILKDACAGGIEEFDLLGGDDQWKFEWTQETRDHRWLFLFRNRLRPRLLHYLKFGLVAAVKERRQSSHALRGAFSSRLVNPG
jgi:CelD/BcsL family acetyltransferase involved in cellulose biosynthesis